MGDTTEDRLELSPSFIGDSSVDENNMIISKLAVPIMHIKRHLFLNSLEAQFRTAFWDPVLTTLLDYRIEEKINLIHILPILIVN